MPQSSGLYTRRHIRSSTNARCTKLLDAGAIPMGVNLEVLVIVHGWNPTTVYGALTTL